MRDATITKFRELFIDELAEVQGGGPLEDLGFELGDPQLGICRQWMTTMACGEEGPPCPSGC